MCRHLSHAAVAECAECYNPCCRLEKLAYRMPLEVREEYELRQAAYRKHVSRNPGAVHYRCRPIWLVGGCRGLALRKDAEMAALWTPACSWTDPRTGCTGLNALATEPAARRLAG